MVNLYSKVCWGLHNQQKFRASNSEPWWLVLLAAKLSSVINSGVEIESFYKRRRVING